MAFCMLLGVAAGAAGAAEAPPAQSPPAKAPPAKAPPAKAPPAEALPVEAPPAEPLYEQVPFDRVTLDETNDHKQYDVELLTFPGRIVPDPLPRSGKLVIRPRDEPGASYEVQWYSVAKIELFEGLIVQEAEQHILAGKLERAYDYFVFLERKYPKAPGLGRAMEGFLVAEFRVAIARKQYDRALAMMRELYERNPKYTKLDDALANSTNRVMEDYLAVKNYRAARRLLANLAVWFPNHPVVAKHQGNLTRETAALLAKAQADARTGKYAEAAENCRQVARIWPALPGARELALSLHLKHPRVTVGVAQQWPGYTSDRMHDWATRRSGRLLCRTLTEFAGAGPDGGTYVCPIGEVSTQELGKRLVFQIKPGARQGSADGALTGYDVASRLLAMAEPDDPGYRGCWAELIYKTSVQDVYRVDVQLHRPHVLPEALLQSPLTEKGDGPYVLRSQSDANAVYLANTPYSSTVAAQPKEIVERRYARGADAIQAMRNNEIDAIDRVNPWDLKRVRDDDRLILARYGAPLLHCLIPNMRRTIPAQRTLRRALVYGIDRQAILDQLTGGASLAGCKTVSGPFLPGLSETDPFGYGADSSITPRDYEPRLALALAAVSLQEAVVIRQKQGKTGKVPSQLVLAHPATEMARLACTSIQKYLKLIGVPVKLRELTEPVAKQLPDDVDLLYAELAIWEPVVDARPLLGDDGLTGGCSSHLALALRQLEQARNWKTVHDRLQRIHRIAHDDVSVIPLWQLYDHFVYRKDIQGIGGASLAAGGTTIDAADGTTPPATDGTEILSLYQNVEQWQVNFYYPAD
ncbi:MAG: hypothetical protein HQ567_06855 [Candidatus Nealsonbacteria bacterium]|nr:hypothetical protein [Candidatus Nealsonbacteria bacterium]